MHFVRIMLLERLISEDEFFQIEMRNRERYKPLIGILLSGKFLLSSSGWIDVYLSGKGRNHRHDVLHYKIDDLVKGAPFNCSQFSSSRLDLSIMRLFQLSSELFFRSLVTFTFSNYKDSIS